VTSSTYDDTKANTLPDPRVNWGNRRRCRWEMTVVFISQYYFIYWGIVCSQTQPIGWMFSIYLDTSIFPKRLRTFPMNRRTTLQRVGHGVYYLELSKEYHVKGILQGQNIHKEK
jgi:hypothetical protein